MLRSTVSSIIAVLCWTQSSLGFVPFSGRQATSLSPRQYSDVMIEEQKEELKSRLPPVDRQQMSKLEIEFRELLKAMLYTPQEMSSITNPRLRIIYEGVAASYYEPAVYRAFEVLYEDYMPLRIAGRMIHEKLQNIMSESKEYQQAQIQNVIAETGLPLDAVGRFWESFVQIAGDRELESKRVELLLQHGQDVGILPVDEEVLLSAVNPEMRPKLSFEEFVIGCHDLASGLSVEALEQLFDADLAPTTYSTRLDKKRAKYSQRYDDMLHKFGEWKSFIPSGEGRRLDILRGCFVGSENAKVVDALRVIYTDYTALRMSGDWIFQVVSTLMNGTVKRRQRNDKQSP